MAKTYQTDSSGRYIGQIDPIDFLGQATIKDITEKKLLDHISELNRGSLSLTGNYKEGRSTFSITIKRLPTDLDDTFRSIYCYCTSPRCFGTCIHARVLLYADFLKNGPMPLTENESHFYQRKRREAQDAEQARRNKLSRQLSKTKVDVLTAIGKEDVPQGLVFYDFNAMLKDMQTNAFFVKRLEEITSSKNNPVQARVTEEIDRTGIRSLNGSLSYHDPLYYSSTRIILRPTRIYSISCDCPSGGEMCQHKLALLRAMRKFVYHDMTSDMTDKAATTFFTSIHQAITPENMTMAKPVEKRKCLTIEPRISVESGIAKLSFKLGHVGSRLIVVRNLADCVNAYNNERVLSLSTKESINFATETLTDAAEPLFAIIQRRVREVHDANNKLQSRSWAATTLSLPYQQDLQGSLLDQFYDAADGMSCEYTDKSHNCVETLTIGHDDMNFTLTLDRLSDALGHFAGVSVSGMIPVLINGSGIQYILTPNMLSRVTREVKRALQPFTSVADRSGYFRFQVGLNHLQEFYYRILPSLIDNSSVTLIDNCGDEARNYLPPEPVFAFYCDLEDGTLSLKATVSYEERRSVLGEKGSTDKGYHDVEQETRVVEAISRYLDTYDTHGQRFIAKVTDDTFYDFLREGVPYLSHFGTVSGTDAFRSKRIRSTPSFTVGVSVDSGIMDLSISSKDLSTTELLHLLESYQKKKKFYRLKGGDYIDLTNSEELQELLDLCGSLDLVPTDAIKGKLHLPLFRALYLDRMLEEHESIATTRDRTYRAIIKNFNTVKDADYEIPKSLENTLRPYQSFGFKWLSTVEHAGFGAILADEMGLGKTLQIIAMLLAAKENGNTKPSLVVCPASLVFNWQEEVRHFAPDLKVETISGPLAARKEQFKLLSGQASLPAPATVAAPAPEALPAPAPAPKRRGRPPKNRVAEPVVLPAPTSSEVIVSDTKPANTADIYVTSYDLLKRDIGMYEPLQFYACILDEAQYIKNQNAAVSKAVKILHADHRFALTGTPIENRLSELWSIFDFIMPGFLYTSSQFVERFESPIAKLKDEEATAKLKKMVGPFILRRRKEDVLKDLPAKLEEVRYARFDTTQQQLYDAQVVHMREMIHAADATQEDKMKILAELTRIRQICCDPSLVFENYQGESAKRQACLQLIEDAIDGGHRMLLFSQFTSMLALLEEDLKAHNIPYYKIIGATPKEQRISLVHKFNEGTVPVFLISLKAGGTGLNLTRADFVIHYDPWWNLAAQNQATDRAHRIGQTKQVTVFRLIAKGTIEEKIVELQDAKKDLADAILEGRSESLLSLSNEELLALLS